MYPDFCKAFDEAPHDIFVADLERFHLADELLAG